MILKAIHKSQTKGKPHLSTGISKISIPAVSSAPKKMKNLLKWDWGPAYWQPAMFLQNVWPLTWHSQIHPCKLVEKGNMT